MSNSSTATGPGSVSGAPNLPAGFADTFTSRCVDAGEVHSVVIPDTGHWVAEEAPAQMLAALTEFLAPYRDAQSAARGTATIAAA